MAAIVSIFSTGQRRGLHAVSDRTLERLRTAPRVRDRAEAAEIAGELADAMNENLELGDVPWRLDEWRRAERACDSGDDRSGGVGQLQADHARDAYEAAVSAQRMRHGDSG